LLTSILLVAISAALFGLAFPPISWTPVAWFALAPLFVAVRQQRLGRALLLTWLWTLGATYMIGDWFPRAVTGYFQQPFVFSIVLFFLVLSTMAAPYYMAFVALYREFARHSSWVLPLLTAAAWVSAELGRGRLFTGTPFFIGNPWGLIGYSQTDWLAMSQVASLTGMYGVSFAILCVNAAIAEAWIAYRDAGHLARRDVVIFALPCLPALVCLGYGMAVLRSDPTLPGKSTPIAIAQANLNLGTRWRSDLYGTNLDVYLQLTREAQREGEPEIVFWPEAAMTFFYDDEPLYRAAIKSALGAEGVELVVGGVRSEGSQTPAYYNTIYSLARDGSVRGRYDKQYLVPFAEYFPLDIDVLKRRFGRVRNFESGDEAGASPLPTAAGLAGILVCNETMLPEVAGQRVAAGAQYLVSPTNDTWISDTKYTEQQFDMAVMRAIEQRRYLVRVSTAGPSAVIDPWGRVQIATEPLTRQVILGTVRRNDERSFYGTFGDLFGFSCVLVTVLGVLVAKLRRTTGTCSWIG
jgi:apolipoprotein N-acyltransferase